MKANWLLPLAGAAALVVLAFGFGRGTSAPPAGARVRLAYFPNLTHAPAIAGAARGEFRRALPPEVALDTKLFNAGPEAMEALLAGEIDVAYVGPGPALNTYLRSGGRAVRLLAGACSGGAALVARADVPVHSLRDLAGRRVGVPQLGGTQDISLRHFLAQEGLRPRERGGSVEILPARNPDLLLLMRRRQIDAAWVPEPWASRLVTELGARLVRDERDLWPGRRFATTVVVTRTAFLRERPALVEALLAAHLRSIDWLRREPAAARALVNAELKRLTGKALPPEVLAAAWRRMEFDAEADPAQIEAVRRAAEAAGYLSGIRLGLDGFFAPQPLRAARLALGSAAR